MSICSSFCISFETLELASSEISDFSDLVPKLQRENELRAKSPSSVYRIKSRADERKFSEIRCWRVKNYL